jgi:hypothetical protein
MAKMGNPSKKADGQILYAADLNNNLDLIQGTINTNDNESIAHKDAVILDHPDASVTTAKIKDANVTTAKIADANVTTAKIADLNVTTAKLADLGVTTGKIAEANVTTTKLADSSITNAKLGANSVTTAKIADANVTTSKITDLNVTTGKLADLAITNVKIASGTITQDKLVAGTLDNRYYTEPEIDGKLANIAGGQSYSIRTGATFPAVTSGDVTPFVFYLTADQVINGRTYKAKRFYLWKDTQWVEVPDAEMVNVQTAIIKRGLSKIYSDQSTPAHLKKLLGRTLVNLLGKDGNAEDTSKWSATLNCTIALDSSFKLYGNNSIKVTASADNVIVRKSIKNLIETGKYYVLVSVIKPNVDKPVVLEVERSSTTPITTKSLSTSGTATQTQYVKFSGTTFLGDSATDVFLDIQANGTNTFAWASGDTFNFDGVRLFEIPQSIYDSLEFDVNKFPYVDSVRHTKNPYFIAYGKNMLPPFTEWTLHANAEVVSPYELKHTATATFQESTIVLDALPNTTYTMSVGSIVGDFIVDEMKDDLVFDSNKRHLINSATPLTFTTASTTTKFTVRFGNGNTTSGTFTISNPMLNLGSTALPFEPANNDYGYIEAKLGSNLDGTVYDTLYQSGTELRKVKRFELDKVLDGTLAWVYSADGAGFKHIQLANSSFSSPPSSWNTAIVNMIKYDGKIVRQNFNGGSDGFYGSGTLFVTLADTDTGWGDAYTAVTADEIKAYFNGWKADAVDAGGKPTSWISIVDGTQPSTDSLAYVSANKAPNYTPYSLSYQLANEKDEPVSGEFALNFHDGDNAVEFGEGVIVREVANPVLSSGNYHINRADLAASKLNHRINQTISIQENGKEFKKYTLINSSNTIFGTHYITINGSDYDTTAQYTITYLLLDKHEHTVNVVESELSYNTNLKTAFDRLVQDATDTQAEVDAIQWDIENRLLKGEGERAESFNPTVTTDANGNGASGITFKRAFTTPPIVIVTPVGQVTSSDTVSMEVSTNNITTTGCTVYLNSTIASSSMKLNVIVLGK